MFTVLESLDLWKVVGDVLLLYVFDHIKIIPDLTPSIIIWL